MRVQVVCAGVAVIALVGLGARVSVPADPNIVGTSAMVLADDSDDWVQQQQEQDQLQQQIDEQESEQAQQQAEQQNELAQQQAQQDEQQGLLVEQQANLDVPGS